MTKEMYGTIATVSAEHHMHISWGHTWVTGYISRMCKYKMFWNVFYLCFFFNVTDEENNRHVVVNCGEALLKNNTYWPLVSDFINILSHQSVAKRFLEDRSLLLLWMSFVSYFQGQ